VQIGVLELQDDVSSARWVVDLIHPLGQDVGSLVPEGFEAYARIFHPAYNLAPGEKRSVGWRRSPRPTAGRPTRKCSSPV
jgi:hypothetical protein